MYNRVLCKKRRIYQEKGHKNPQFIYFSGFEHVFVGELKNNKVTGFHGWINLYLEEKSKNLNYYGYIKSIDFGSVSLRAYF